MNDRCSLAERPAGCSKLVEFRLQGNCLFIRAKDASPHNEPQTTGAMKHERPIQRQFYPSAGWYHMVYLKKNAVRTNVEGPAESTRLVLTFPYQLVLQRQSDRIPPVGAPVRGIRPCMNIRHDGSSPVQAPTYLPASIVQ